MNKYPYKMMQIQLITAQDCRKSALIAFLFVFIMQQHTATSSAVSVENQGNETDRIALLAIRNQLIDGHPKGFLSTWNHSLHHCDWDGVTCDPNHLRVVALDFKSKVIGGTLSPYIGNLSFIQKVLLPLNNLRGKIPPELGRLLRLRVLDLSNNTFTGEIPTNLSGCINLQQIDLGFNNLLGKLPMSLGTCSKLKTFSVHFNHLSGLLFDIIGNLTSLETISTTDNAFTGTIPSSIERMHNLTTLFVGENHLSGVVPTSIYNLSALQIIELVGNNLQGKLPEGLGVTLSRLERLNLSGNKFHGQIPASITNLTRLELIAFEENNFVGKLPHDFSRFKNLQTLDLYHNHLEGNIKFLDSLVNCSSLQVLDLRGNKFTGNLPKSFANLSATLIWLALGNNQISGEIPVGINNLVNLEIIYMGPCQFKGTLPDVFGSLQNLEQVDFSSNMLTGNIPSSFGNLSKLSVFYLNDNKFEGSLPPSLGNSQSLLYLDLSRNGLNGSFPSQIFGGSAKFLEISVSQNRLEGSLPMEIGKQVNLVVFDVSGNKLSGDIPSDMGECSGLQTLDLSKNNLSGTIPNYLSMFPLVYINLSYNNFLGKVPTKGIFVNASAISLVGNIGLCGGMPKLNLPRCVENTKRNKKRRLSRVFVLILSISSVSVGVVILATLLYFTGCLRKRKNALKSSDRNETFPKVSYNELLKATNGFALENLLGEGAFGSVFKGVIDGETIAVKVLKLQNKGASKSFMAECKALRNIRHRNLVAMITACSSIDFKGNDFKALVYEFMSNGSVDGLLHREGKLGLLQRVDIAIDVAHALCYLHNDCEISIVHYDLKPSNVLLNSDMVAKVGDFGLSKFLQKAQESEQSSTIGVAGTVGYAAPEYGLGSEASTNGDLYSYGILLLELMTGKTPTDSMFKENCNLHTYVEAALPDQVLQVVDPTLEEHELFEGIEMDDNDRTGQNTIQRRLECIASILGVGVACSHHLPQRRMKLPEATMKLKAAKKDLLKAR